MLYRCGMIYMEPSQLGWDALHRTFVLQLIDKGVTEIYIGLFEMLVEWLIPPTLEFMNTVKPVLILSPMHHYRVIILECFPSHLNYSQIHFQTMSTFFMTLLNRKPNYNQTWFQQSFLYCYAWAYCSTMTVENRKIFDALLRKIIYGGNEDVPKPKYYTLNRGQMYPEKFVFMDYRFDEVENWWPWLQKEEVHLAHDLSLSELMVPTKETECILYWLEFCVINNIPIMLTGPTGTGKSATVLNYMHQLPKEKFLLNVVNFSARSTAQSVQDLVMSKLDRRRKGVFGPPVGKKVNNRNNSLSHLLFLFNIHMICSV